MKAQSRTPTTSTLGPAAAALAKDDARLHELEGRLKELTADLLRREAPPREEHKRVDTDPVNATKVHALRLVTGSAAPLTQPTGYLDVLREAEAVREAIEILSSQRARSAVLACAERYQEHKAEHDDCWSRICTLIISIERELQAKDEIERKIGALIQLPGQDHRLLGRLSRNETVAYRLLEQGVKLGWLSPKAFADECKRATAADAA